MLIAAAGELAQVVERLLRMREVPESIPDSPPFFFLFFIFTIDDRKLVNLSGI